MRQVTASYDSDGSAASSGTASETPDKGATLLLSTCGYGTALMSATIEERTGSVRMALLASRNPPRAPAKSARASGDGPGPMLALA